MSGTNVGDLFNAKGLTWGWFQGGFKPSSVTAGKAMCATAHNGERRNRNGDYIPHHEPFQYYASTSNPHHLPPTSVGHDRTRPTRPTTNTTCATSWTPLHAGNMPAVSYLKAAALPGRPCRIFRPPRRADVPGQHHQRIMKSPHWNSTAIIITYDDSDGWYDHVMGPIVNLSNTTADA